MMEDEPITYTNSMEGKSKVPAFITSGIFGVISLAFLIGGIYVVMDSGLWPLLLLFSFIGLIMGALAFVFYPSKKQTIYSFELDNEGLHQYWENTSKGINDENHIPFENIDHVLIGVFTYRMPVPQGWNYFRFGSLMIIMHQGNYFFRQFESRDEWQKWMRRIEDKVPLVTYTGYDLSEALRAQAYSEVDFSEVEGTRQDIVSEYIGEKSYRNPFQIWMPEEVKEEVRSKTERNVLWILFGYALLFGSIIMPNSATDSEGIVEMTDIILFGYLGINLLIPCVYVFWRRYTKWYNLLLYAVVVTAGTSIGLFVASLIMEVPSLYGSALLLNMMNILFWTVALIIIKVILVIFRFWHKYNV
ncbi:hypothetical protein [Gracilibacillus timonensis]|uniref:hypothetical protein n=1 Tax=Gracilibacillus timonensis TaxID=1816696 RepID=UPI0008255D4E|nr:hypothetical protein [Gracilibacillus timonensis]